jgi:hypothetical protein
MHARNPCSSLVDHASLVRPADATISRVQHQSYRVCLCCSSLEMLLATKGTDNHAFNLKLHKYSYMLLVSMCTAVDASGLV